MAAEGDLGGLLGPELLRQGDAPLEGRPVRVGAVFERAAVEVLADRLGGGDLGHELGVFGELEFLGQAGLGPAQAEGADVREVGEVDDAGRHFAEGVPVLAEAQGQARRMGDVQIGEAHAGVVGIGFVAAVEVHFELAGGLPRADVGAGQVQAEAGFAGAEVGLGVLFAVQFRQDEEGEVAFGGGGLRVVGHVGADIAVDLQAQTGIRHGHVHGDGRCGATENQGQGYPTLSHGAGLLGGVSFDLWDDSFRRIKGGSTTIPDKNALFRLGRVAGFPGAG